MTVSVSRIIPNKLAKCFPSIHLYSFITPHFRTAFFAYREILYTAMPPSRLPSADQCGGLHKADSRLRQLSQSEHGHASAPALTQQSQPKVMFGSGAASSEAKSDSKTNLDTNNTIPSCSVKDEKPSTDVEEDETEPGTWAQAKAANPQRKALARIRSWIGRARLSCFR